LRAVPRLPWHLTPRSSLAEAVRDGLSGGVVALVGAPGVGKTTLADEVARHVSCEGGVVYRIAGSPATAPIPWSALAPLVGGRTGDEALREALAAVNRGASGGSPPLLVVDDAHHLDEASAVVVHQLATSGFASVVVTLRSNETVPTPIRNLLERSSSTVVSVEPLDESEATSAVRTSLGGDIEPRTLRLLLDAAAGVPLHLRELIEGSRAAGVLTEVAGVWRFTGSMRATPLLEELVLARIGLLDTQEREALDVLAVAGRIGLDLAQAAVDLTILESLERHGVITVDGDSMLVDLVHPVYADLLRARMGMLAARRHYRVLAQAEAVRPVTSDVDQLRMAVWQVRSGAVPDPELAAAAAGLAISAGDASLASELALAVLEQHPSSSMTLLASRALSELGRHDDAERVLRAALGSTEPMSSAERAGALFRLAEERWWWARDRDGARALLESGRSGDSEWDAILDAQHGVFDLLDGDVVAALERAGQYRQHPSASVRFVNGIVLSQCCAYSDASDEGFEIATRCFEEAMSGVDEVLGDPYVHVFGQVLSLIHGGRLAEARDAAEFVEDAAALHSSVVARAWASTIRGFAELFSSWPSRAVRPFASSLALWAESDALGPARWSASGLALARVAIGDVDGARAALEVSDRLDGTGFLLYEPFHDLAGSWVAHATDDVASQRRRAAKALDTAVGTGARVHVAAVSHDLARLGMHDLARSGFSTLPADDGPFTAARRSFVDGAAAGDIEVLVAAGDRFVELGADLFAAESFALAASAARRSGTSKAFDVLDGRAGHHASIAGHPTTPPLAARGQRGVLSLREEQVATLAAAGLSNRSIADRLVIGERTVETHLYHAFAKLGVTSRRELGSALDLH
jgi:DNA-binding CsgD family transcriptional regulator